MAAAHKQTDKTVITHKYFKLSFVISNDVD